MTRKTLHTIIQGEENKGKSNFLICFAQKRVRNTGFPKIWLAFLERELPGIQNFHRGAHKKVQPI
jgi:hypothetical protein